jgi:transcription antitermination factor NusA-like protein
LKSPICSFDAKTGVLCSKCEEKLRGGDISQDDVDASTKLARIADRNQEVNKFTLLRGVRVDGDVVLVLRSPDVSLLRGNNALSEKIESDFGHKVWFVESEASDRRFIEGLFHPIRVLSVNLFWLPDGNKLTKVMASGNVARSRFDLSKVQKIAKAVRNIELLVEFEQR